MNFSDKERICNKFYWTRQDLADFFEYSLPKATQDKKIVFKYMLDNNIKIIDRNRMPFRAIKEALDIDEDYIRKQARKEIR